MIQLTKFSLKNRAAIVIMVFIISALGVSSGLGLPMEFLPSVDNPMVSVTTFGHNLDAKSMAKSVTEPLEKQLKGIKYVDSVTSTTTPGLSAINVMFTSDADMKEATKEVERIAGQLQLPQGVMKPFVAQLNTDMIPIAQMSVKFKEAITLENESFLKEEIVPKFESIDGVSNVIVYGASNTEIELTINQQKLLEKQITAYQVIGALQGMDVSLPAGELALDGKTNSLRVIGEIDDVEDIKNLFVAPGIKVTDVAEVELKQQKDAYTQIDGQEALALVIQKESGENAVEVGNRIKENVEEVNKQYGDLLNIEIFQITSDQVENAVTSMAKEVGMGALFASVVILLFLRNIRATIIAVVSIPLSIFLTLYLLKQFGITLNVLSLGGLAVAVGRLVDDSIVVIENIFRRLKEGERTQELILHSTREVAVAITSSTITTVAVFLPIGFVEGALGEFFLSFALTVTFSLLSSLLVALTVVPLMGYVLFKKLKHGPEKNSKLYTSVLNWSLNHKLIVLLIALLMFGGSIAASTTIPQAPVNSEDETLLAITMTYPTETESTKVIEGAKKLESYILQHEDVEGTFFRVGASTEDAQWGQAVPSHIAMLYVGVEPGGDTEQLMNDIKSLKEQYLPAEIDVAKADFSGFGGGNNVNVVVTSEKSDDLAPAAQKVMEEMKKIKGLEKVESNYEEKKKEWIIQVDLEKAQSFGLTPEQVGQQIGALTGKTPVGMITFGENPVPVMLKYDLSDIKGKQDLLNSFIISPFAGAVPLSQVATMVEQESNTTILHKDGKEYIQISAAIADKDSKKVGMDLNQMIEKLELPSGVEVTVGGVTEEMMNQFADLFKTMAVAIGIVYLVMVITFGQARAPFAILFTLPLAAIGAILGLVVSQTPLDITSLIGALMLIGIVVTNAIVLIDRVHQKKEEGMNTREALLEAGATRLRPILMTAIATICAMLPLLFGQDEPGSLVSKGLAVVVIGGLSVSTLLTLVVVPVIYELLDRIGKGKKEKKKQDSSHVTA